MSGYGVTRKGVAAGLLLDMKESRTESSVSSRGSIGVLCGAGVIAKSDGVFDYSDSGAKFHQYVAIERKKKLRLREFIGSCALQMHPRC
tara:strand:+ start:106 stop:372 length:267 start_codon:yes stop_codon:yes gene_type:complete